MHQLNQIAGPDGTPAVPHFKKRKPIVILRQVGNLLFTSGHGPEDQITGKPLYTGRVGADLTPEEGYAAARECAIILLGGMRDYLGSLERIKTLVKATALVNVASDFYDLDHVADGFSDLMMQVLDERGYHARTIMGTHNLPNGNIPVEIELIAEIF